MNTLKRVAVLVLACLVVLEVRPAFAEFWGGAQMMIQGGYDYSRAKEIAKKKRQGQPLDLRDQQDERRLKALGLKTEE